MRRDFFELNVLISIGIILLIRLHDDLLLFLRFLFFLRLIVCQQLLSFTLFRDVIEKDDKQGYVEAGNLYVMNRLVTDYEAMGVPVDE